MPTAASGLGIFGCRILDCHANCVRYRAVWAGGTASPEPRTSGPSAEDPFDPLAAGFGLADWLIDAAFVNVGGGASQPAFIPGLK
jgi:hypothetical protein